MKIQAVQLFGILLTLTIRPLPAQTDIWTAPSGTWSAPPNWSSGAPLNNGTANVSFGVGGAFSSTVNNSWNVNSVSIANTAGPFLLTHNGPHILTVQSSLTDSSGSPVLVDVVLLGGMSLNMVGNGLLTLSQDSTYTGATLLSGGTFTDAVANAFSPNSDVRLGAGSTLSVNFDETISSLSDNSGGGSVDLAGGTVLNMTGATTGTFSGVISGLGGIQLGGSNVLTLTGTNTYSGSTVIGPGSTLVAGSNSAFGTSAVSLSGNAVLNVESGFNVSNALSVSGTGNVLAGNGTFHSPVTVDPTLTLSPSASPGNGPGNLSFTGPLTLASGGTIVFRLYDAAGIAGNGYSLITATGGLNFTASANSLSFDLVSVDASGNPSSAINFNPTLSYSWMFATSPTVIGGFLPNQFNLDTAGFTNVTGGGSFSFTETGNSLYLNFTPVPEPSTWMLLGMGVSTLMIRYFLRRADA